ncbi:hypothetical protein GY45DRAFT_1327786 [Cubamyces sp. BRFM 1775]|nr:hypothetical protein GY45DRAFT_1327786 [Cubamyces sp. BRFM 1775]
MKFIQHAYVQKLGHISSSQMASRIQWGLPALGRHANTSPSIIRASETANLEFHPNISDVVTEV